MISDFFKGFLVGVPLGTALTVWVVWFVITTWERGYKIKSKTRD